MKGDIRIVKGELETLPEVPSSLDSKSKKYQEIYKTFKELIEVEGMNHLFKSFYAIVGVPIAIIDLEANVLASSSWNPICTNFHRVNAESCAKCHESDISLANDLSKFKEFNIYRCKNGMTDSASPIIIENEHIANLFVGQYLLEKPDREFFINQAERYGYDTNAYLNALDKTPILSAEKSEQILDFLVRFAKLFAVLGMDRLREKEASKALQELNENLEQKVKERTDQLEKTNQLLQETINKQEDLLKVQNVGFAFLKKRKFTWINEVLEHMLGYEKNELVGKESRVVYASEKDYQSLGKYGYSALADKGVYTQEMDFVKKDGEIITFLVSMTALSEDLNEVIVVLVDVTETSNLRKQLEQLNQNLHEQVKIELAKNIEQKSILEQQAKMAEMGEMISAIAHQLKQPLNAISIGVQTIEDDILEGDKEFAIENLQKVDEQSRFMADTIDEFRNYFKKDTQPVLFNIKKAVESVLNILGYQLKMQSITMDISRIDANIDFYCNPNAFKQVILNLINNAKDAIKGKKAKGGKIEISCQRVGDSILFAIQDNGGGIPHAIKDKIFEPYFTTKASEGTGVGLSIIKSIVEEKMNGTIQAENKDDGALFTITLPQ